MKFGVREICDVVLKAKATQKVGNKIFYKNEPVIYFDTLKTSSLEGAATTVYAQGGRGNSRLMAWEGERTVTFTMEDALISPVGFMILSGAGLVDGKDKDIQVHTTERIKLSSKTNFLTNPKGVMTIQLSNSPYDAAGEDWIYVMVLDDNGDVVTEPYLFTKVSGGENGWIELKSSNYMAADGVFKEGAVILADYYVTKKGGAQQIEITPDKFGGNYYLEASTLFRDTNGVDMPAEFIIPNCKIQSNFTFTMASSGDPSSFTFTMDAFPDYTRFDKEKKVLAAIQIISEDTSSGTVVRESTEASLTHRMSNNGIVEDNSNLEVTADKTINLLGTTYDVTEAEVTTIPETRNYVLNGRPITLTKPTGGEDIKGEIDVHKLQVTQGASLDDPDTLDPDAQG